MIRLHTIALLCLLALVSIAEDAHAKPQWLSAFTSRYPAATELTNCGVCHNNFTNNSARNAYGNAWKNAGGKNNPSAGFAAIENADSDGDGTSNIDEINTGSGFYPGWTCDNTANAVNEPADLLDVVDPSDPGCLGGGTTTTVSTTSSTSTTSTSSTTLPEGLKCAQPISTGAMPVASDCLFILGTAVGTQACAPDRCICDPSGDGAVVATDALLCLSAAVGTPGLLNCMCGGAGGDPVAGEQIYDTDCGFCHAAGAHDPVSEFASDIADDSALLVQDLGTLSDSMTGLLLTDQDIADLTAFLSGL